MPTPEEQAQTIFGERAAYYASSTCHADPEVLAQIVERLKPQPDWTVADIATGTGHTAFAVAAHVSRVVALDLTREMLYEGMVLAERRGLHNVRFVVADALALPLPDAAVHGLTARRAPHHFSNIGAALREMCRVLVPGGRLVVDDRSVPEDDFVDSTMNELDRLHDPSHVRQYRPAEWEAMLSSAGFRVERVEPYTIHRPITSLTETAPPGNAERIREICCNLTATERDALQLVEIDGQRHINHWYVTVTAVKP